MLNKKNIARFHIMLGVCFFLLLFLLGRMVQMQMFSGDYYLEKSEGNRLRKTRIIAPRGLIYDGDGNELARNIPGYVVLLQKQNKYADEMIRNLAGILNMQEEEIKKIIKDNSQFGEPMVIKRNLTMEEITKIEEQKRNMPSVILQPVPMRNYPKKEFLVHALGYVGEVSSYEIEQGIFKDTPEGSIVGKAGLEKYYDKVLRGEDGAHLEEVDSSGAVVKNYEPKQPVPGRGLKLTIDSRLQNALEDFAVKHLYSLQRNGINARAAAVVAMDPRNGAIKAMLSCPGYDPNLFVNGISTKDWNRINNDTAYPLNNKVISGEYPPGSTFKIVTGTAAFELNKVGFNEPILDRGFHPLVPTMGNAGGEVLGWLTFETGLAMSDNVYFYELGYRVGIDNIGKYARIYGFGERTGIDIGGESKGLVASKAVKKEIWNEDWRLGDTFNAAIGQGFNLTTPLQLAVMLSTVANGGTKYKPYLVDSFVDQEGKVTGKPERDAGKKIDVSQKTIDYIRIAMAATTREGGTAAYFSALPKPIAGKTGTAENSMGRDHGLFVAYGPVDNPELVVVCIVEQGGFGSTAAGPIVYRAFEEFFREKGWMPDPVKEKEQDNP
ncbi:MAG: penicillin-binding protein 2 [Phascolarctobacterium sp.]|nr:penicillin-binding protein 2 [Phascolarctobacterium sp.]